MGTVADKLLYTSNTKAKIRNAITAKGVSVPEATPFRHYPDKILAIPQEGGSASPDGRPPLPFVDEPEDNTVWMLYGVGPTGMNDMAFQIEVPGGYFVDWGDGNIDAVDSKVPCEHIYDYTTMDTAPTTEGIKWVWIKFYPQTEGSAFTYFVCDVRPNSRPVGQYYRYSPRIFEVHIKATCAGGFAGVKNPQTQYMLCDTFRWYGKNNLTSLSYGFSNWNGLKTLSLDTSNVTNFEHFCSGCTALTSLLNINTSKGRGFTFFLSNCSALASPLVLNIRLMRSVVTGFLNTRKLNLPSLRLQQMGSVIDSLDVSHSSLSTHDLELLFGDLCDRRSSNLTPGTINIISAAGAEQLTTEQCAIATDKNWTIVG